MADTSRSLLGAPVILAALVVPATASAYDPNAEIELTDAAQTVEVLPGVYPKAPAHEIPIDWDAFLDFNSTCWDETHGIEEPPADGEYEIDFDPNLGLPSLIPEETLDSPLPLRGGRISTRNWDEGALQTLADCVEMLEEEYEYLYIQPPDTTPQDLQDCMDEVMANHGDPCVAPDSADCLDLEYHASWCGGREFLANGSDPSWTCAGVIDTALQQDAADPGNTIGPVLLPEEMHGAAGTTRHYLDRAMALSIPVGDPSWHWDSDNADVTRDDAELAMLGDVLERAQWAMDTEVYSCAEYAYERYYDLGALEATALASGRSPRAIFDRAYYDADPMVTSAPTQFDFRKLTGDPSYPANMSQACSTHGLVDWPVRSFSATADKLAHPERGAYRIFERDSPQYECARDYFTFKNVYYYLYKLRSGPPPESELPCGHWRAQLQNHYRVDAGWHLIMDQHMANAGYLDEELTYLAAKQEALWEVYSAYLATDDPSEKAEHLETIDQALVEGARMGCIPTDPNRLTPCDWSPSYFAEGAMTILGRVRQEDYLECVEELGEGTFGDADLTARFVEPALCELVVPENPDADFCDVSLEEWESWTDLDREVLQEQCESHVECSETGVYLGYPNPLADLVYQSYLDGINTTPTASDASLALYLVDVREHLELLLLAVDRIATGNLVDTADFEKSIGNDIVGASFSHHSMLDSVGFSHSALSEEDNPFDQPGCKYMQPFGSGESELRASLLGGKLADPFLLHTEDMGAESAEDGGEPAPFGAGSLTTSGIFRVSEDAHGNLESVALGATGCLSSQIYPLPTAPVPDYSPPTGSLQVVFRFGFSGSVGVKGCVAPAAVVELPGGSAADEADAANGMQACPEVAIGLRTSVEPSAAIKMTAALGVTDGFLGAAEVGIKGVLTFAEIALPISLDMRLQSAPSTGSHNVDTQFGVQLVGRLLKGVISAYLRFNVPFTGGLIGLDVVEIPLVTLGGAEVKIPLIKKNDSEDVCAKVVAFALLNRQPCGLDSCSAGSIACEDIGDVLFGL